MVNGNIGSFKLSYIYIYSRFLLAFNSTLRINLTFTPSLTPPPYFSPFYTHSHAVINSSNIFNKSKVGPPSRFQRPTHPFRYRRRWSVCCCGCDGTTTTPNSRILGSLTARAIPTQQFAYVASLSYPEWGWSPSLLGKIEWTEVGQEMVFKEDEFKILRKIKRRRTRILARTCCIYLLLVDMSETTT